MNNIANFTLLDPEKVTQNDSFIDNMTTAMPTLGKRNEQLAKIEIAVQVVILCLAVIGNGLVLIVMGMRCSRLSRMNLMIVHLSLADLFVAFFNVLPQLMWDVVGSFKGGMFLCKMVTYFQVVAMYSSSYVLVTTAIDRWLVICHPLTSHTWTNKKLHLMVGVAWLLSLVFATPQFKIFSYEELAPGSYNCHASFEPEWTLKMYITWFTVAIYIVPTLLLMVAYGRICFEVWKSIQQREAITSVQQSYSKNNGKNKQENGLLNNTPAPRTHSRGMTKAKIKTVKLTITVIVCYLVCWGPFFVAQMWAAWDPNAPFQDNGMVVVLLLASLNSCCNPFIFFTFSIGSIRRQSVRKHRYANVETSGARSTDWMSETKTTNFGNKDIMVLSSKDDRF